MTQTSEAVQLDQILNQEYDIINQIFSETKSVWSDGSCTAEELTHLINKRETWVEVLKQSEQSKQEYQDAGINSHDEFIKTKIREILGCMAVLDKKILNRFQTLKEEKIKEISKIADIHSRRRTQSLVFEQKDRRRIIDIQQE